MEASSRRTEVAVGIILASERDALVSVAASLLPVASCAAGANTVESS